MRSAYRGPACFSLSMAQQAIEHYTCRDTDRQVSLELPSKEIELRPAALDEEDLGGPPKGRDHEAAPDAVGDVGTEPGEGQKVKLVNQLLCGVHIAVAAEALAYAEALGLQAGPTWEVLRHGAAALPPSGPR